MKHVVLKARAPSKKELPASCREEVIKWLNVRKEVANILSWSGSMCLLMDRIHPRKGNLDILSTELPSLSEDLGLTGRSPRDPKSRDLVGFQFAWSKIKSRFELASIMAHEYEHARQSLSRRFTATEAAPFLSLEQYLVLRWSSEYEAYNFQALVLKEIVETMPDFEPCRNAILVNNQCLSLLTKGKVNEARNEIINYYDFDKLSDEHKKHSRVSPEERKAMEDVKNNLEKLLRSEDWKKQESTWNPFILKP